MKTILGLLSFCILSGAHAGAGTCQQYHGNIILKNQGGQGRLYQGDQDFTHFKAYNTRIDCNGTMQVTLRDYVLYKDSLCREKVAEGTAETRSSIGCGGSSPGQDQRDGGRGNGPEAATS